MIARDHHTYILGTSESLLLYFYPIANLHPVLHPALRSRWFRSMADKSDPSAQEAAVYKAETIFQFVAETYLTTPSQSARPEALKSPPRPVVKTSSFLSSACPFDIPTTTSSTRRSPAEELRVKIDDYLAFQGEAPPRNNEEYNSCLMDPLGSWKVCFI